jgi:transcriptional regulator with XRE-family HTH domain
LTDLGLTLRRIREARGLTMTQFAHILGCNQSSVSRYEAGKLVPSRTVLLLAMRVATRVRDRSSLGAYLGIQSTPPGEPVGTEILDTLRACDEVLGDSAPSTSARRRQPPASTTESFARVVRTILLELPPPPAELVEILQNWVRHFSRPEAAGYLRRAASYLHVGLSAPPVPDPPTDPESEPSQLS